MGSKLLDIVYFSGNNGYSMLTMLPNNWCSNDYDELLPGHFMRNNMGEILCHNRQTGR